MRNRRLLNSLFLIISSAWILSACQVRESFCATKVAPPIEWARIYEMSPSSVSSVQQTTDGGCALFGARARYENPLGSLLPIVIVGTVVTVVCVVVAVYFLRKRKKKYSIVTGEDGKSAIIFGDGEKGARPPSGMSNVKATYGKRCARCGALMPVAANYCPNCGQVNQ